MNVKKMKLSADCTSKTNAYIVLPMNDFCYCGSPTFTVPLNLIFTFPFEGNSCKSNSFRYFGSPTFSVPLNPNFTLLFEGNSCQMNRNYCQLP